ncbi:MAG: hypothetical protein ABH805_00500 [Candidatus Nealsonbacteria bacterium]
MLWLEKSIDTFSKKEHMAPKGCRDCFLRKIAVLIVSGQIVATQITKSHRLRSFWLSSKRPVSRKNIHHGSDWHRETMAQIRNHFRRLGYKVSVEPDVYQGRADLAVYKKGKPTLFIELGTTSFYKLWMNLERMSKMKVKNFVYLIVRGDNELIEFRKP